MLFKAHLTRQLNLSLCGVLLLVLIVEWAVLNMGVTEESVTSTPPASGEKSEQLLLALAGMRAEDYATLSAAPLFVEGRRPVNRNDAGSVTSGVEQRRQTASQLRLLGLTISEEKSLALIVDSKGIYYRLFVGDEAFGWVLSSVQQDSATLKKHDKTITLTLEKHKIGKISKRGRSRKLTVPKSQLQLKK